MTETKMSVQLYVWKPSYYKYLYEQLLSEIEETFGVLDVPRWKKDILLLLLEHSIQCPPSNKKVLRKIINNRVKEIADRAFEY